MLGRLQRAGRSRGALERESSFAHCCPELPPTHPEVSRTGHRCCAPGPRGQDPTSYPLAALQPGCCLHTAGPLHPHTSPQTGTGAPSQWCVLNPIHGRSIQQALNTCLQSAGPRGSRDQFAHSQRPPEHHSHRRGKGVLASPPQPRPFDFQVPQRYDGQESPVVTGVGARSGTSALPYPTDPLQAQFGLCVTWANAPSLQHCREDDISQVRQSRGLAAAVATVTLSPSRSLPLQHVEGEGAR